MRNGQLHGDDGIGLAREVTLSKRIFLLSPANASGVRAKALLRDGATFELAKRLQCEGLPLGEAFSFISGLYFRGKLAYANAFATPPASLPGTLVITACGGLLPPDQIMKRDELRKISAATVEASEVRYRVPLQRDARRLAAQVNTNCEFVLLGSVATSKYVEPLLEIFGEQLVFPEAFAGRGDMSRGGLMLRCVRDGVQLNYISVMRGDRHGTRPARLPKLNASGGKKNGNAITGAKQHRR